MDFREAAIWLVNEATDEQFAEAIILANKIYETGDPNAEVTAEDMKNADINKITEKIRDILKEIIFSEEINPDAWWKQAG